MAKIIHRADFLRLALPVLLFPCICAALAYFYSIGMKPIYASKVVISTPENVGSWNTQRLLTDIETMKSGKVLVPVIKTLQERNSNLFQTVTGQQLPEAKALEAFRKKHLFIQHYRGTPLIEITVTAEDPKEARMAVTAVADSYADFYSSRIGEIQKAELQTVAELATKAKADIKATDALLAKQKKKPKNTAAAKEWTAAREKLETQKKSQGSQLERLEAKLRGEKDGSNEVRIVQKAEDSEPPLKTDYSGNLLLGILGGLIAGVCFSVFKIRTGKKSESNLVPARS